MVSGGPFHWCFISLLLNSGSCVRQSATEEKSLYGIFTLSPWDKQVDWILEAKAAPCYVTVSALLKCSGRRLAKISRQATEFCRNFLMPDMMDLIDRYSV